MAFTFLQQLLITYLIRMSSFQVAYYNYMALKDFFKGFPEFSSNDFYVTGESYAGVYVPTLSELVMEDNAFNFKVRTGLLFAFGGGGGWRIYGA